MTNPYIDKYREIFEGGAFIRNGAETNHDEYKAFDGGGTRTLADKLLEEVNNRKSVTILDYGCGLGTHWHKQVWVNNTKSIMNVLGEKVQGFYRYDPAYELYSKPPLCTFDLVICSDVLEHVPDEYLEEFFFNINNYVKKDGMIFYSISTKLSKNSFDDGTNMHVNIKSVDEWFEILKKYSKTKICVVFNGKYKF
jgi:2-polyprenyl-3-methyl-5-hydroxy-6-metoxy-1,4-benzoquinol methylase